MIPFGDIQCWVIQNGKARVRKAFLMLWNYVINLMEIFMMFSAVWSSEVPVFLCQLLLSFHLFSMYSCIMWGLVLNLQENSDINFCKLKVLSPCSFYGLFWYLLVLHYLSNPLLQIWGLSLVSTVSHHRVSLSYAKRSQKICDWYVFLKYQESFMSINFVSVFSFGINDDTGRLANLLFSQAIKIFDYVDYQWW